jgi:hypothetical protein
MYEVMFGYWYYTTPVAKKQEYIKKVMKLRKMSENGYQIRIQRKLFLSVSLPQISIVPLTKLPFGV